MFGNIISPTTLSCQRDNRKLLTKLYKRLFKFLACLSATFGGGLFLLGDLKNAWLVYQASKPLALIWGGLLAIKFLMIFLHLINYIVTFFRGREGNEGLEELEQIPVSYGVSEEDERSLLNGRRNLGNNNSTGTRNRFGIGIASEESLLNARTTERPASANQQPRLFSSPRNLNSIRNRYWKD